MYFCELRIWSMYCGRVQTITRDVPGTIIQLISITRINGMLQQRCNVRGGWHALQSWLRYVPCQLSGLGRRRSTYIVAGPRRVFWFIAPLERQTSFQTHSNIPPDGLKTIPARSLGWPSAATHGNLHNVPETSTWASVATEPHSCGLSDIIEGGLLKVLQVQ